MNLTKNKLITLIEKQKQYAGRIGRAGSILSFLFIVAAGLCFSNKMSIIAEYQIFFGKLFLIALFMTAGFTIWLLFKNMRRLGLVCPYCDKLIEITKIEKLLNTSKCKKCGKVIIKN